ncbi:MAG: GNAT family N-acetyltransferase [Heyndrickxia sp.]
MHIDYNPIGIDDLEDILTLWNDNIGVLFPLDERLLEQNAFYGSVQRADIYGAFYQNRLIGMISFKCYKDIGYISFLIVDIAFRKKGIGNKLIAKAEQSIRTNEVVTIHLGSDPYHFFPGVPLNFYGARNFFQRKGFVEGSQSFDLICDISKVNLDRILRLNRQSIVQDDKYNISLFQKEDLASLHRFFEKNFPGRWYEETIDFIEKTGQFENLIILNDRESDCIIGFCRIYTKESKLLGPSIYWRGMLGDSYGGLGPIGIDIDYRKKGLGFTFLYQTLEILQNRKIKNTVIDWTVLLDFYGSFNFLPWKTYVHMSKTII